MPRTLLPIAGVLDILSSTPRRLTELTADSTGEGLRRRPSPEEWSCNEVLAHLRACADQWGSAIATILAEDRPTIRAVNPRRWIEQTDYRELAFATSLRAFTQQRAELLALLEPLPEADWSRSATLVGGGKPLETTVLAYGRRLARHERPHVKQVARTLEAVKALRA